MTAFLPDGRAAAAARVAAGPVVPAGAAAPATSAPLLELDAVARRYALPRTALWRAAPTVRAVDGVSLAVTAGLSVGVVGESGSGKSTLARLAMALEAPDAGSVRFLGADLNALGAAALRRARRDFQMVFQDPYGSLDPRRTVARIVAEPLRAQGAARGEERDRVADALAAVGLRPADAGRYPHEFSGGQRQRVAIARALVTRPKLIVADEPVSALDVSVQAQVLNLLDDLRRDHGVTYLFISHDLAVVEHVCDAVAVMYRGRVVEQGPARTLLREAAHPYTRALLDAVPRAEAGAGRRRRTRRGDGGVPADRGNAAASDADGAPAVEVETAAAPAAAPACPYAPRCPWAGERCVAETPLLRPVGGVHVACHHAERVLDSAAGG